MKPNYFRMGLHFSAKPAEKSCKELATLAKSVDACLKRCCMSMGRVKLPAAVPDRQSALARERFLSK
jgi:hypothetical protein